jgi:MFS family permease
LTALWRRYAAFFALPDVTRLVVMAMIARLPMGMQGLGLLLHVRAITGSYADAGSTVGSYLAAAAATAPLIGRLVDRIGPRLPLIVTGSVCPVALVALLFARPLHLAPLQMMALAAFAGAFAPPVTVLTRTLWRHRFEDDADTRRTAFAVDAVLVELSFTVGPGVIATVVALGSPNVAYAVAVAIGAIAVPVFFASPALKWWRHEPQGERHLLGPLTAPRLLVIYGATLLQAFCLGLLEVGYPGFATAAGATALSGVLLALNSTGSALGGVAYGGLRLGLAPERQLRLLPLLLALALAAQVPLTSMVALGALALVAGLFIAPSLTVVSLLVSSNAPARYATEAFTWSTTCIVSGVGAGIAVGGHLVEQRGAAVVFGLAACAAVATAIVALGLHPASPRRSAGRAAG